MYPILSIRHFLLLEKSNCNMEKELERLRKPVLKKSDKSLDELLNKGYFKEKIEMAEHIVKTYGLPDFDKK